MDDGVAGGMGAFGDGGLAIARLGGLCADSGSIAARAEAAKRAQQYIPLVYAQYEMYYGLSVLSRAECVSMKQHGRAGEGPGQVINEELLVKDTLKMSPPHESRYETLPLHPSLFAC